MKVTEIKVTDGGEWTITMQRAEPLPDMVIKTERVAPEFAGLFESVGEFVSAIVGRACDLRAMAVKTKKGTDFLTFEALTMMKRVCVTVKVKDLLLSEFEPPEVVFDELSEPEQDAHLFKKNLFEIRLLWLRICDYCDQNLHKIAAISTQMRMFETADDAGEYVANRVTDAMRASGHNVSVTFEGAHV